MGMKRFPLDCTIECPHYKTWDMSVDDWASYCDLLKVQVDDCDGWGIRYRCPLEAMRCKNCRSNHQCSIQFKFANADDEENLFCANFNPSSERR